MQRHSHPQTTVHVHCFHPSYGQLLREKKRKTKKSNKLKKNEFILSFLFYVSVIVTLCTCLYSVDCLMAKIFRSLVEMKYDYNGKIKRLRFLPVFLRICLLYTFFPL